MNQLYQTMPRVAPEQHHLNFDEAIVAANLARLIVAARDKIRELATNGSNADAIRRLEEEKTFLEETLAALRYITEV